MGWLTGMGPFGVPRWAFAAIALIGAVTALIWAYTGAKRADTAAHATDREVGAQVERGAANATVIERTEQGNETRKEIEHEIQTDSGGRLRYDQCLRAQRSNAAEVCKRFLPQ